MRRFHAFHSLLLPAFRQRRETADCVCFEKHRYRCPAVPAALFVETARDHQDHGGCPTGAVGAADAGEAGAADASATVAAAAGT